MTITNFSVPIDIPWRRIAFSEDMMDAFACDRSLPLRWRSSVAVFEYEPPPDEQEMDGMLISYLKVSCSITGYQPNGAEIQIRNRISESGWTKAVDMKDALNRRMAPSTADAAGKLEAFVNAYYPCYGAMIEVVVAPPRLENVGGNAVSFKNYPYFVDFDPKKREMYEQVTETGESLSRSLDEVNVKKGRTTLQSHEVKDRFSIGATAGMGAGASGGAGGKDGGAKAGAGSGASVSAGYESTTTDLTQRTTENIRTTDAAREARETLSHTTQMSHLYQLLNSYHVGTNRAAFFVQSRPHTNQLPATFVNGPREIEGIQDFMLVVARPATQERFCVEAYLETAHLIRTPKESTDPKRSGQLALGTESAATDWERDDTPISLGKGVRLIIFRSTERFGDDLPEGYEVDIENTTGITTSHGGGGGYKIETLTHSGKIDKDFKGGDMKARIENEDYRVFMEWDVQSDHVTLNATTVDLEVFNGFEWVNSRPASLKVTATIYLKKRVPAKIEYTDELLLTARAVCSCDSRFDRLISDHIERGVSIVHERAFSGAESRGAPERPELAIRDANRYSAQIRHAMVQSMASPDRYPRGKVSLIDTQLFANVIGSHLEDAESAINPRLGAWRGDGADIAQTISRFAPRMTRAELLRMSLPVQVERFGITFDDAVLLRRALTDLPKPESRPTPPEPKSITVPQLTGRYLIDAAAVLTNLDLDLGKVVEVDNQLDAGLIIGQDPAAGAEVEAATEVMLSISSGLSIVVPNVFGLPLAQAMCTLLNAGLRSDPIVSGPTGNDTRVAELEPPAGTPITPHATVTVRLRRMRERREPIK